MVGKQILHYRVLEKLAQGGVGHVYKAEDTRLQRTVALKFLSQQFSQDISARKRFMQEARAVSALEHPNICVIYDIEETEDGDVFISMPCYKGQSLRQKIDAGPLELSEAFNIIKQIGTGLAQAHKLNIIHRDIKPENIIVTDEGEAKILDFGLAKVKGTESLTSVGTVLGTLYYMSPEQLQGKDIDHRTDIYALGILFYEMITGQLPFDGENEMAMLYAIMNNAPAPITTKRSGLPSGLDDIITKSLARKKDSRYSDVNEFLLDIEYIYQDNKIKTTRVAASKGFRRRFLIPLVIIVLILLSIFIFKLSLFQFNKETKTGLSIAVLPFENVSTDSTLDWLEWGIQTLLTTELNRSKEIRVVDMRGLMDINETAPKAGLQRLKSTVTVFAEGKMVKTADGIMINTSVIENKSDEVLISADTVIHNDSEIYNIVSKLASQIRASLEIKSAEEEVDEQWLKGFTTNSVEAYREFVFGHERFVHTDWLSARRHYRNAIAKDSSFALAYVWLATVYQMLNDYHGTQYCYQKASQLRHKLSFKEQLFVDILRTELEENYSQQIYLTTEIVDRWDPESNFWQFILGRAYLKNRQYQKAVETLEGQYLRGWPFVYTYYFLAESYASLDQFGESLKVFEAGLNQHRTFTAFYAWMSAIYYKLKDHSNYEYYKEQFFKTTSVQLTTAPEQYLEAGNGYRH
ncbi:MAG: protein kinase domain-containing protein, partial [Planctomycetota bacterium]